MQFSKIPIFYYWYSSANSVEFFKRSGRRRAVFCSAMRFWRARCGTPRRYEDRLRHPLNATRRFLIVPRRDKDHPRQHGHAGHHHGEGRHPIGCAHMGGQMGGGIFAKTAKTPPLQSGVCGEGIALSIAPHRHRMRVPCHPASPHEPVVFTTTRHAASLRSSNNCKYLIETFFIARGESPLHKRLNPYGLFPRFPFWNTAV